MKSQSGLAVRMVDLFCRHISDMVPLLDCPFKFVLWPC